MTKKLSKPRKVNNHLWHYQEEDYVIQRTWSLLIGRKNQTFWVFKTYKDCETGSHIATAINFYGAKAILKCLLNDSGLQEEITKQREISNKRSDENRKPLYGE
jgi:hypothetical protein